MRGLLLVLSCVLFSHTYAEDAPSIHVLGIAQDAGYPQANCYQPHCLRAWNDKSLRRTASSIAVVDPASKQKLLFDATPHIADQLYRLQLIAADDEYTLAGVFPTHAHIGHYTGLMYFGHEVSGSKDVPVYAMPRMRKFLETNGPWDQLVRYKNIAIKDLQDGAALSVTSQLTVTPLQVPHRDEYSETVGFRIDGPSRSALYIPDINKWEHWETDIRDLVRSVDYALLDATFYTHGELPGRDMSNVPHPLVTDSMDLFDELTDEEKSRVIFIHMNHTNPLLIDGSPEQAEVFRRGFRFAREGMRLGL